MLIIERKGSKEEKKKKGEFCTCREKGRKKERSIKKKERMKNKQVNGYSKSCTKETKKRVKKSKA